MKSRSRSVRALAVGEVPELTESARAVFKTLATSGPNTRPVMGELLSFSKPTMSAAVGELEAYGLVASHGISKGASGRTAVTYGLGRQAGHVIGIDAGTTRVRAIAATLDGRILTEVEQPLDGRDAGGIGLGSRMIDEIADSLQRGLPEAAGPVRAVTVALPTIVSSAPGAATRHEALMAVAKALPRRFHAPVLLENNVNCAALAERHVGAARGRPFFIYLQVGVKIGLGIVMDGRLLRGVGGAAGEVGRLPFPWSAAEAPRYEGLEHYLGSTEFVARCARDWPESEGPAPTSPEEIFARAVSSPHARGCVDRHAADIGRLVAACVGILDPGFVVLGGGVGQNAMLVEGVRKTVAELTWATEIAISELTSRGTVLGALQLAADFSLASLLGEERHPAFVVSDPEDVAGGTHLR
ncbi:Sugar kinase of the NBD/HSP70 family, may contain an N-terminal HTH domain [Faunimonas pinastri]|uniref:Sugar kinase of the NBD/HSP70 family, may contain an N-terminal HTH domain n=1 Tax=Faunimonas pinastri TaxID=1855383 RepID=A0A1H9CN74_9HYPH|nr:ROK family protein [Faunimonas pinastri]SEQ02113.1 Sugar kinase of the NBD/HSP70 family, may contain an N-terminal HTH domain [Faunimonas pinastri]